MNEFTPCEKCNRNFPCETVAECKHIEPARKPEPYEMMDDDFEEVEFQRCSSCDGHDACEDFGCAFKLGLGHLVNEPL